MFKKRKGINLPYNRQGLIYFTCMEYRHQPIEIQQKINNLCMEVAGEDYRALWQALTTDCKSILRIASDNNISEKKLYEYRKRFYEKWE